MGGAINEGSNRKGGREYDRLGAAIIGVLLIIAAWGIWRTMGSDGGDFYWMGGGPHRLVRTSVTPAANGRDYTLDLGDGVTLEMVWVPGGTFEMGSRHSGQEIVDMFDLYFQYGSKLQAASLDRFENERPLHEVELTGFWMGKFEVTNAQFRRYDPEWTTRSYDVSSTGESYERDGDDQPACSVDWREADEFVRWLKRCSGGDEYRMPSEAQWEYACRAGTETLNYWGDDFENSDQFENLNDHDINENRQRWDMPQFEDGYWATSPVGSFKPNPFGLYDMMGNVEEWCADWADWEVTTERVQGGERFVFSPGTYYGSEEAKGPNPEGPKQGREHVSRGSSFLEYGGAYTCRAAKRNSHGDYWWLSGFRVVRIPTDDELAEMEAAE